ncbi:MAG: DUF350 domain-containing protein [Vulcanimicrobiota bacterium]
MDSILPDILRACGWAFLSALLMGVFGGLGLKFFDMMTPGLDEVEELRKGNIAVAIVIASVILAIGLVMATALIGDPS